MFSIIWKIHSLPFSVVLLAVAVLGPSFVYMCFTQGNNIISRSKPMFHSYRAYSNSWTLDARVGRCTLDPRRWTLDARPWMLDSGRWTLDSGRWTLDAGLWTLDPGRWTLDAGLWTLGA